MVAICAAPRREPTGDRRIAGRTALIAGPVVLLAIVLLSIGVGAVAIPPAEVARILLGATTSGSELSREAIIVLDIRLPRTVLGVLVGAALAVSGAMMQGLFRNPLADPGIVGVSSGAALGAVASIVFGHGVAAALPMVSGILLPLAAFGGGLAATLILYTLATRHGRTAVATMLLAGIAIGAFCGALTGLLVSMSDDQQLRQFTFWSLGSLGGATWAKIGAAAPFALAGLFAAPFLARGLNALALGEAEAFHLGIDTQRVKRLAIFLVAASVGAAVAVSGVIGFIGLVVPHLLRLTIGPDHRYLLPASAIGGAGLILLADTVARTVVAPAELPIGIVTAIIGAPFFLWLLLRDRSALGL